MKRTGKDQWNSHKMEIYFMTIALRLPGIFLRLFKFFPHNLLVDIFSEGIFSFENAYIMIELLSLLCSRNFKKSPGKLLLKKSPRF